jgi:iron-sulfur cluster insertion protein
MENRAMSATAAPVALSDSAAAKVAELIAEDGNPELKLRIAVSGGGCAGFKYDFSFDASAADDDFRIDKHGACVLIDAISLQYLAGAEIDYEDNFEGARFLIKNLQASATCGCGSSFSV